MTYWHSKFYNFFGLNYHGWFNLGYYKLYFFANGHCYDIRKGTLEVLIIWFQTYPDWDILNKISPGLFSYLSYFCCMQKHQFKYGHTFEIHVSIIGTFCPEDLLTQLAGISTHQFQYFNLSVLPDSEFSGQLFWIYC